MLRVYFILSTMLLLRFPLRPYVFLLSFPVLYEIKSVTVQWQWKNLNQISNSEETPHISPNERVMGCPFWGMLEKMTNNNGIALYLNLIDYPYFTSVESKWKFKSRQNIFLVHLIVLAFQFSWVFHLCLLLSYKTFIINVNHIVQAL